jgi:hypothetical protein
VRTGHRRYLVLGTLCLVLSPSLVLGPYLVLGPSSGTDRGPSTRD